MFKKKENIMVISFKFEKDGLKGNSQEKYPDSLCRYIVSVYNENKDKIKEVTTNKLYRSYIEDHTLNFGINGNYEQIVLNQKLLDILEIRDRELHEVYVSINELW